MANFRTAVINKVRKDYLTLFPCSLEESGPLKFTSTESLLDSSDLNLYGRFEHFQIRNQGLCYPSASQ